jgi:hypothetical protein
MAYVISHISLFLGPPISYQFYRVKPVCCVAVKYIMLSISLLGIKNHCNVYQLMVIVMKF